jgi:hypothetical protein
LPEGQRDLELPVDEDQVAVDRVALDLAHRNAAIAQQDLHLVGDQSVAPAR